MFGIFEAHDKDVDSSLAKARRGQGKSYPSVSR